MVNLLHKDPLTLIERFTPLKQISHKYHTQLASQLQLISIDPGETIIRKTRDSKLLHFLVKGSIEVRVSFDDRYSIDEGDSLCSHSLEQGLKERSSVKALDTCTLLIANTDQIDQYLSWSQDYTIFYLDDANASLHDNDLIDYNFQEDWDNVFIRSRLAANLSNRIIHQLMSELQDIAVKAGETIVKAHSNGDYFYVIKEGQAEVQTDASGPFKGENIQLGVGSYFGDEALIANTPRNATVTMATEGVLGRLDANAFENLIKQQLVSPFTKDVRLQGENIEVLDVRFPMEYKHGHESGSINMPISFLRKQLHEMKESLLYVITPANDSRAELATYLMRQAGFQAYHLADETAA